MTTCVHEIVFSLGNNDYENNYLFAARIVQVAKGRNDNCPVKQNCNQAGFWS